jgi:hypothetical protein
MTTVTDGQKEACKTYIEQTKLLVALASAFIFAPPALLTLMKDAHDVGVGNVLRMFVIAEALFVASVLAGYVVLGCVTGSQNDGSFDVFRLATRMSSILQLVFYLLGVTAFVVLAARFF